MVLVLSISKVDPRVYEEDLSDKKIQFKMLLKIVVYDPIPLFVKKLFDNPYSCFDVVCIKPKRDVWYTMMKIYNQETNGKN